MYTFCLLQSDEASDQPTTIMGGTGRGSRLSRPPTKAKEIREMLSLQPIKHTALTHTSIYYPYNLTITARQTFPEQKLQGLCITQFPVQL